MKHNKRFVILKDGYPCEHKGCLNHKSHPCECCGRIAGRSVNKSAKCRTEPLTEEKVKQIIVKLWDSMRSEEDEKEKMV